VVDCLDLRIYSEVLSFICSGDADDFAPKLKTLALLLGWRITNVRMSSFSKMRFLVNGITN